MIYLPYRRKRSVQEKLCVLILLLKGKFLEFNLRDFWKSKGFLATDFHELLQAFASFMPFSLKYK